MNELYPIKFIPIFKEKIWGGKKISNTLLKRNNKISKTGESWEISSVENNLSIIENGIYAGKNIIEIIDLFKDKLLGNSNIKKFGYEFPLLIKFIDADDVLSVQVHPDENYALEKHKMHGKNEMWYILENEKNASIITGFNKTITREECIENINNNSIENILNFENVSEGDIFYIPTGRIHAIGKGILLAEIQQTSDITYRVYDWNRIDFNGTKRELHIEEALDVLDFKYYTDYKTNYKQEINCPSKIINTKYFTTNLLWFSSLQTRDYTALDSFVIFICVKGSCEIINNNSITKINFGETILIPASLKTIKLQPDNECKILEVFIEDL